MSNQNYTKEDCHNMSNQEICDIVSKIYLNTRGLFVFLKKRYPTLLNEIIIRTPFLTTYIKDGEEKQIPLNARIYCLRNNISQHPKCKNPHCTHEHNFTNWNTHKQQFNSYCCSKCKYEDSEFWKKVQNTTYCRIGVRNPFQSKEIQQKIKNTNNEKYGCDYATQSEVIKQKTLDTNMKKYHASSPTKNDIVKKKIKRVMMKRYGVEYPLQSNEIKERFKQTCKDRFNVDNPFQSKEIQDKQINTMVERYGVDNISKLNSTQYKIRKTCIDRYGVEHPCQLEEIQNRVKQTNVLKYGVEYYSQTEEYHRKKKHKYHSEKYPELTFDSTWEVKVYEFCKDNNIQVEYSPAITYEYEYDGKTWTYHPDFLINDNVYEVKGDNFFRVNESINKEEMFCPYRYVDWSDEHYIWMCGKYEAKHQCMIKNNVVILRNNNIKNLSIDIFQ